MLAHFHPLAVSAGELSGRVQTAPGEETRSHLHVSHHFCANLHLVLQTIGGLLLKTHQKKKSDESDLLKPEPAGSHRSLIASLSVKRQTMTDVALAFPANSLFSQIA